MNTKMSTRIRNEQPNEKTLDPKKFKVSNTNLGSPNGGFQEDIWNFLSSRRFFAQLLHNRLPSRCRPTHMQEEDESAIVRLV